LYGGQTVRDVLQGDKGRHVHQILAEEQRRRAWTPLYGRCRLGFRARVLGTFDDRHLLENPVRFRELADTGFAILKTVFAHHAAIQTVKNVEEFVCVAAEQRSCQYHRAIARRRQRAQGVSLCRLTALQLMNFVRDAVVEESIQVAPNELDRCHAVDLLVVGLP
jgi:hypothetical protein